MITVKPASPTDGSDILNICRSIPGFNAGDYEVVDELWTDFLKNGGSSPYAFCVSRDNQQVLGFACFGKHALTQSTYDLYWIAVDPNAQGQGVGGALLDYVEEAIKGLGGTRIIIETSSTEPYRSARHFYLNHDYQQEATLSDFYSPGDHLLFYTKKLPLQNRAD